jgi:hypothetical protein
MFPADRKERTSGRPDQRLDNYLSRRSSWLVIALCSIGGWALLGSVGVLLMRLIE